MDSLMLHEAGGISIHGLRPGPEVAYTEQKCGERASLDYSSGFAHRFGGAGFGFAVNNL